MIDFEKLKPIIIDLIQYYYEDNPTGGYCHIALDDGNLMQIDLLSCKKESEKDNDYLGKLICEILIYFTEEERENMYESFWGMDMERKE